MKLELALITGLFLLGFAISVSAGTIEDFDSDLVPHPFDNCSQVLNGPNQSSNQVDTDVDGFGNACDMDLDNNNSTGGSDFAIFVGLFGTSGPAALEADFDGDLVVGGSDFARYVAMFGRPPGPSGLSCAGSVPCTP